MKYEKKVYILFSTYFENLIESPGVVVSASSFLSEDWRVGGSKIWIYQLGKVNLPP